VSQPITNNGAAAEELAATEQSYRDEFRHELFDELPRRETFARLALDRPERFHREHETARNFLLLNAHQRVKWLTAALAFLDFAPVQERFVFITGDHDTRDTVVQRLLIDCGFKDKRGAWRWL